MKKLSGAHGAFLAGFLLTPHTPQGTSPLTPFILFHLAERKRAVCS